MHGFSLLGCRSVMVAAAVLLCIGIGTRRGYAQGAQESTPALIDALAADDPMVRAAAACELGQREAEESISALIELLADDTSIEPFTCSGGWNRGGFNSPGREAARALVEIGGVGAEAATRALNRTEPAVREKAVWILGALEHRPAVEEIERMLTREEYVLGRANAAWALGAMEASEAVPSLARALGGDDEARVRAQAAWALGAIGDDAGVDGLVAALKDENADVRKQVAWALGAIGDPRAEDGLVAALEDESVEVRKQAVWALSVLD